MVKTYNDRIFNMVVYILLGIAALIAIVPLLFVVSASITPMAEVFKNGGFILFPKSVTLKAYEQLLDHRLIPSGFKVSIFLATVGTAINMVLTTLMAYPLSRKGLPGRSFFLLFVLFTMIFRGGLIPTYLVVKNLGLLDTVWAMIMPNAIWAFNTLIMKSFFENLPNEMFESARIDGAGETRILLQIILPLSKPVMMTIGLFYMVGHWNQFFQGVLYISSSELKPLQLIVREILLRSRQVMENVDATLPTKTLQMASVVFASVPIICVYPFIQKHFTKGIMLGAVKG